MTNHGCSVCRSVIAVSTRNDQNAYAVSMLRGNDWTERGIVCTCGALNPFDAPAVYVRTIASKLDDIDPIQRDRAVKESLKHGK